MVGHGGSSASSFLADPTSSIPSNCAVIALFLKCPSASIVVTSTFCYLCFCHFSVLIESACSFLPLNLYWQKYIQLLSLVIMIILIIHTHTKPPERLKWPPAITRQTAHFICSLISSQVICKQRKCYDHASPNVLTESRCLWKTYCRFLRFCGTLIFAIFTI